MPLSQTLEDALKTFRAGWGQSALNDPVSLSEGLQRGIYNAGFQGKHLFDQAKFGYERALPDDYKKSLKFWESSNKNAEVPTTPPDIAGMNPLERGAYWSGRIAGDIAGDITRGVYWRYNHPLGITHRIGSELPTHAGYVNEKGFAPKAIAALSGLGLATALDITSGNTDITNLDDWGRPKGYSAIFADPLDPTKSTAPLLEAPVGYLFGRKGKMLPYEQFVQERPDVSPEKYNEYKTYLAPGQGGLLGIENLNPVATGLLGAGAGMYSYAKRKPNPHEWQYEGARRVGLGAIAGALVPATADLLSSLGIVKGTWSNLDNQPEVQLLGYKVPLSSALLTTAVAGGLHYGLNRAAMRREAAQEAQEAFYQQNSQLGAYEPVRNKFDLDNASHRAVLNQTDWGRALLADAIKKRHGIPNPPPRDWKNAASEEYMRGEHERIMGSYDKILPNDVYDTRWTDRKNNPGIWLD